jgi:hypothetical protein
MVVPPLAARMLGAIALAMATSAASTAAMAQTLVWSETTGFTNTPSIATATPPGATTPLVTDQTQVKGPNGVEFLGGRLWWPNQQRIPISNGFTVSNQWSIGSSLPDGSDVQVISTGGFQPYDLDLQGNLVYWTDQNNNVIRSFDVTTARRTSSNFLTELTSPFAIDVTADAVYWSEVGTSNRIMRSDSDGTNITTLLTGVNSYDFEVVGSQIYYTTTGGAVLRSALDGSGLTTLASGLGFLNGIDVTDDAIYVSALQGIFEGPGFTTLGAGRISRMNLDGSGVELLHVAPQVFTSGVPFNPSLVRGVAVVTAPVPEPGTYALMLAGVALVAGVVRRRR